MRGFCSVDYEHEISWIGKTGGARNFFFLHVSMRGAGDNYKVLVMRKICLAKLTKRSSARD